MTSQKDQIQGYIAEIDRVLQKTTPRLPWVISGEVTQQRQVLERVRNYLVVLQRRTAAEEGLGQPDSRTDLLAHDIYYQQTQAPYPPEVSQRESTGELTAQQMLQAVTQEISHLRSNLMQSLQSDVETLRQQREGLVQELQHLEAQRRYYEATQPQVTQQQIIHDFLQALMGRLQETLSQQVAQTMRNASNQPLPYASNPALTGTIQPTDAAIDADQQSPQQVEAQQARSDQMIVNLDSTLNVVFASLQRDVQAYHDSLSQGLEKMHNLGQQGEMMFAALINHLAEKLGREASSYMQSSVPGGRTNLPGANELPARGVSPGTGSTLGQPVSSSVPPLSTQSATGQAAINLPLPFPGTELPLANLPPNVTPSVFSVSPTQLGTAPAELNVADLDLGDLDLSQMSTEDIDELLQLDVSLANANLATAGFTPSETAADITAAPSRAENSAEIDEALKLLEQLSSELQDEPSTATSGSALTSSALDSAVTTDAIAADERISEGAHDELDEFYESLFGVSAATTAGSEGTKVAPSVTFPVEVAATAAVAPAPPEEPTDSEATHLDPPAASEVEAASTDLTLGWDLFEKPAPADSTAATSSPAATATESAASLTAEDKNSSTVELEPTQASSTIEPHFDEISSLVNLFRQPLAAEPTDDVVSDEASSTVEPHFDEISSLTELFRQPIAAAPTDEITAVEQLESGPAEIDQPLPQPPEPLSPSPAPVQSPAAANFADDRYTPALPEENLLPIDDPLEELDEELWLDETTLNSLDEDLSSLEEPSPSVRPLGELELDAPAPNQSLEQSIDVPRAENVTPADTLDEFPLEDWSDDSLDDFVAAAPDSSNRTSTELAVDSAPAAAGAPASAPTVADETNLNFTLDDLNNLFADSPAPPVSPVPPPAATIPNDQADAFTLEGMDDIFADSPAPPVSPVPPPAAAISNDQADAFTLEGMDDIFADSPQTPPSIATPPEPGQSAFSLTEMDELFADSATETSGQPVADYASQTDATTLETINELFPDVAPTTSAPGASSESPTFIEDDDINLEGIDDLFADAPPVVFESSDSAAEAIDQVDPVVSATETTSPLANSLQQPPTSTRVGVDHPAAVSAIDTSSTTPESAPSAPAAFTVERVNDVLMEVPSPQKAPELLETTGTVAAQPAKFAVQRVDDLLVEVPLTEASAQASASGTPLKSQSGLTLDQAFESIMGAPTETSLPESEKKKESL